MTGPDPYAEADNAARELARRSGLPRHDVALVLGSGWLPAVARLGETRIDLPVTELPGFAPPAVAGHPGRILSIELAGGIAALVFAGRTHLYEGFGVDAVVHAVRTAAAAGCRTLVLTNGCGGLNADWVPGTPVLISDHLNLTGTTPLRGPRFVDMTDVYSPRLRALCRELDPSLAEGVYVQFHGPQYETPAEVRMARILGGDLVGMSTALEAIAAREAGLEVLGISLVTNLGAGMTGQPLDHAEVLAAGAAAAGRMGALLAQVLERLPRTVQPALDESLAQQVRDWVHEDPDHADELTGLLAAADAGDADAAAELADAFSGTLTFGTAGLRGRIGGGPHRMNRVVVRRAAAGLAGYLVDQGRQGGPVVVGYDARRDSGRFAQDTCAVLAGAGLVPLLLPRPLPTPVLAAAVRARGAAAGVMVTASHNPAQDNGYKVYADDGAQIVSPVDVEIAARIAAIGADPPAVEDPPVEVLGEEVVEAYLDRVAALPLPGGPRDLAVAYTALHGVGSGLMRAALARAGFDEPLVVAAQDEPDPAFPTVAFPNPEEPGAMDQVLALATQAAVDLILANDPDADRCAVGIPSETGSYRMLTGDEVGALLGWWLVERGRRSGHRLRGTYATSIVSSQLLGDIARAAGLGYRETLTGFKWIARASDDLVFGYEEALGYCVDPSAVRDKDGISAGLLIAEAAAALKADGRSIGDVLDDLADQHGVHATVQVAVRLDALEQIAALMARLRAEPPRSLGGLSVCAVTDLAEGSADLPPTDGLRLTLDGADGVRDARVVIRPSGTEPKVKAYLEVRADRAAGSSARPEATDRLTRIAADVRDLLTE